MSPQDGIDMRRIKKRPNPARLSGYSSKDVMNALGSMANQEIEEKPEKSLDTSKLTEEQKIRMRAAGYLKI